MLTDIVQGLHSIAAAIQGTNYPRSPSAFSVYCATAPNSSNAAGGTRVPCDTKVFDLAGEVDITTNKGRWTCTVPGLYFFSGLTGNTAAGTTLMQATLVKNGVAVKGGTHPGLNTTGGSLSHVSGYIVCLAGDYVQLNFLGGNGSIMYAGQDNCFFNGCFISSI